MTSGGMLDALGPLGPPLSFSPHDPLMLVENNLKGNENLEVNKGLKKILVSKRLWCLNRSSLGTHTGMKRAVNEHGSMGATGEGRGQGLSLVG